MAYGRLVDFSELLCQMNVCAKKLTIEHTSLLTMISICLAYFENLSQNIRFFGGTFCSELLESAFNQIEELIESGDGAAIQETFNLCDPLDTTNAQEIATFYYILIQHIAQYLNNGG